MKTKILFFNNPEIYQNTAGILESGRDEHGFFVFVSESCYFPGGGGQEADLGEIILDNKSYKITGGKLTENLLKLYMEETYTDIAEGTEILINIDKVARDKNSKLHSAGHLLSSIVFEQMKLDLIPIKGYHYSIGSHVEFSSELGIKSIDMDEINRIIELKVKEELPIFSSIVNPDSNEYKESFKTSSFAPLENSEIRLVRIGDYLAYACGGTHVLHTGYLKGLKVTGLKSKKGNLRVKYEFIDQNN